MMTGLFIIYAGSAVVSIASALLAWRNRKVGIQIQGYHGGGEDDADDEMLLVDADKWAPGPTALNQSVQQKTGTSKELELLKHIASVIDNIAESRA